MGWIDERNIASGQTTIGRMNFPAINRVKNFIRRQAFYATSSYFAA